MIGKLLNGWKSLRENLLLSRKVDFGKACYNAIFKKKKTNLLHFLLPPSLVI